MPNDTSHDEIVATHATTPDALVEHRLAVIGFLQGPDGTAALLRSSRGRIARVEVGDTAFGVRIVAIDEARIVLNDRWGQTQTLDYITS